MAFSFTDKGTPALAAASIHLETRTGAVLRVKGLKVLGRDFGDLRAECATYAWANGRFDCSGGRLAGPGLENLPFRLAFVAGRLEVEIFPERGEHWRLVREKNGDFVVSVAGGRPERLPGLIPLFSNWKLGGRLDGRITLAGKLLQGRLRLTSGSFADKEGSHAGEKLALEVSVDARRLASSWSWQTKIRWLDGEIYWQPVYAKADGQTLVARGSLGAGRLTVADALVALPGIGKVTAGLEWDLQSRSLIGARLASDAMDLERGGDVYLRPFLAEKGVPEMVFKGRLSLVLGWDSEGLQVGSFGLADVAVADKNGRFSAAGIAGGLPWRRGGGSQGYLAVAEARIGDVGLGAFRLPLKVDPDRFSVERTEIPFLGSQLNIDSLAWRRLSRERGWEGELGLSLHPLSLFALTKALGLPAMTGSLSASFPRLRYRDGAAYLDGALVIQVFEGFLNCTRLRLEDPFGPSPRLSADIEAHNLNLGQLTETFSFGRIEGYADGEIRGLELAGWSPREFDARVFSSPGSYRKRISQRAVQNLSSLGGAGGAIQASALRVFEEFGYERLGISCRLRAGVCEMGGVEDTAKGYVLVKGGGIPALTVIGYNRRVDWPELMERLQGIIRNNVRPVIH